MQVVMRSFDAARSGANLNETILTPRKVGSNLLVKRFSLHFGDNPNLNDDPRLEAQPLYVSGVQMGDGKVHDVVYVCTMATMCGLSMQTTGNQSGLSQRILAHLSNPNLSRTPATRRRPRSICGGSTFSGAY